MRAPRPIPRPPPTSPARWGRRRRTCAWRSDPRPPRRARRSPPSTRRPAWLDLRAFDLGDDPSEALLERGRVALNAGPTFGPQGAGHARLKIGPPPALVEEA